MQYTITLLLLILAASASLAQDDLTIHRGKYKQDFLTDPRSPLKEEDLKNLDFFPALAMAVVEADFVLTPAERPFEMPTYSGVTRTYRKYGVATFQWGAFYSSVVLYENMANRSNPMYTDYLFLPFTDSTNGETTYGGGRYLNMSKADTEDGKITIDFNKAYNPWCAYGEGFNCPIPPLENKLPYPIDAGEKKVKSEE